VELPGILEAVQAVMTKDPRVYLAQILERIERIIHFPSAGKDEFFSSPLTQDAVIRNFEVIGEAAKRIPDGYRTSIPLFHGERLPGFAMSSFINTRGSALWKSGRLSSRTFLA